MMDYKDDPQSTLAKGSEEITPQKPVDILGELNDKHRVGSMVESEDPEVQDKPAEIQQYWSDHPVRKATKRPRLAESDHEEEEDEDQLTHGDEPAATHKATGRPTQNPKVKPPPSSIRKGKGRPLPVKPVRIVIDLTVEVCSMKPSLLIYISPTYSEQ